MSVNIAAARPAREALSLTGQHLLHAGPPITWDRMCWPMRGAVKANQSQECIYDFAGSYNPTLVELEVYSEN
jgi:hypothetical protein